MAPISCILLVAKVLIAVKLLKKVMINVQLFRDDNVYSNRTETIQERIKKNTKYNEIQRSTNTTMCEMY